MSNLVSENLKPSNPLARDLKNKLQSSQSTVESAAHKLEEEISSGFAKMTSKANDYVSASRHYVEENPVKSVALAAASGLMAGGLVSFILRKKKSVEKMNKGELK